MEVNNKMQRGAFFLLMDIIYVLIVCTKRGERFCTCDSVVHKNTFGKVLKRFLDFSDFDTTYISPNRYNYALMLRPFHQLRILLCGQCDQRLPFLSPTLTTR